MPNGSGRLARLFGTLAGWRDSAYLAVHLWTGQRLGLPTPKEQALSVLASYLAKLPQEQRERWFPDLIPVPDPQLDRDAARWQPREVRLGR